MAVDTLNVLAAAPRNTRSHARDEAKGVKLGRVRLGRMLVAAGVAKGAAVSQKVNVT